MDWFPGAVLSVLDWFPGSVLNILDWFTGSVMSGVLSYTIIHPSYTTAVVCRLE